MSSAAWVAFLVAAGIGAPARYLLDGWVQDHTSGPFPFGTFVVNISGCFVLGLLTGLSLYHGLSPTTKTIIGTGGVGTYTTFSTFTFETVRLAEEGAVDQALRYAAASFVIGLAAAFAGIGVMAAL
ncbi:MAG TPA: fluoride efflux transporter CrcB [Acidimicrobiia bacterium]|jgi:CrcB protein